MIWLLVLLACTTTSPNLPTEVKPATPPVDHPQTAIPLGRVTPDSLEIAPSTRPGGPPDESFSPLGEVSRHERRDEVTIWKVPLPVHSNLFPSKEAGARSFGNWEPAGLEVWLDGQRLRFKRYAATAFSFGYNRESLLIGLPEGVEPPTAEALSLRWRRAAEVEARLHLESSGMEPAAFAQRTITIDLDSYTGVLLPAPSSASWTVSVPERGVLGFRATLLEPAIVGATRTDGATVLVEVTANGETRGAGTTEIRVDGWRKVRADLSEWAGQEVQLTLRTTPGETTDFDLVFLEEPTIYTPSDNPRRVIVGFLDTVRPDHLGFYGYERDTTPELDTWAPTAMRMDNHRTVAPWTLPSARAAMTGQQPELYQGTPTLPQRLAEAGYYTDAIVGNAYLSQTFEMHRGFSHYRYQHLVSARDVINQAHRTLERWPDRDVMLWVQFMDAHLPYNEPRAYRSLFASSRPDSLRSVARVFLVDYDGTEPDFDDVRQHVIDRYDQNIRFIDAELSRLVATAGADATVALFADHGEEFWDHDGYEHGHAFYDELIRVPWIVASPHLPAGSFDAPTSLLDLTPTLLHLEGLPHDTPQGLSIVDAAFGDEASRAALQQRPQGFGRPLYGADGWGVVAEGKKWVSRDGSQSLFDVAGDPAESSDLAASEDMSSLPAQLQRALDREVVAAWRISFKGAAARSSRLEIKHPQGIEAIWSAYSPRDTRPGARILVKDGVGIVAAEPNERLPGVVYAQPKGDPASPGGLEISLLKRGVPLTLSVAEGTAVALHQAGETRFGHVREAGLTITADLVWVPVPAGEEVGAFHPDLARQLEELGYLDKEEPDEEEPLPKESDATP